MSQPIMIMAGGTGGHVFPALAVADYLNTEGVPVLWLGTEKGLEARVVPEAGYELLTLSIAGIRGKSGLTMLLAPFRIIYAVLQALTLMLKYRPAAVLGMGGFASGPGGIAAWLTRTPVVIHEQNAIAGMTNKYLSNIASIVFEAFPGAFSESVSAVHVGNPVRAEIQNIRKENSQHQPLRVLVVGGSLGAMTLNNVVPETITKLIQKIDVWHQTGKRDFAATKEKYLSQDIEATVEEFLNDMDQAYAWADVVICRSGALTVSELAAAGLPAVLVPYPYAVDDHQTANGKYLENAGAAIIIQDEELTTEKLSSVLNEWLENPKLIKEMAKKSKTKAMQGATEKVANALREVAYG